MYRQVTERYTDDMSIKRSEFITTLVPINSVDDAESELNIIRKLYSDATHNCYAYIANDICQISRFSDDGEPQGTAGMPMLEVLKRRNMNKTLAVVTRYFGGIKLGAGGLVSAYSSAVSEALNKAKVSEYIESAVFAIVIEYYVLKPVVELIGNYGKLIDTTYDIKVSVTAAVNLADKDKFIIDMSELTLGKAIISEMDIRYIGYDIKE